MRINLEGDYVRRDLAPGCLVLIRPIRGFLLARRWTWLWAPLSGDDVEDWHRLFEFADLSDEAFPRLREWTPTDEYAQSRSAMTFSLRASSRWTWHTLARSSRARRGAVAIECPRCQSDQGLRCHSHREARRYILSLSEPCPCRSVVPSRVPLPPLSISF